MRNLLMCAAILVAPLASAGQPLPIGDVCLPEGIACTPRSCEPALDCRFDVDPAVATCAVNLTIGGRTCQTTAGAGTSSSLASTGVYAGVGLSNGSVSAHNLPNSWMSPSAHASGSVAGNDLGHTEAGAYRSDILTEGPRGGPYGEVAPSLNHTWTEVGVFVRHDSPAARDGILIAIWFLDLMPDGCFVRTQGGLSDTPCPSVAATWNYVPALA